MRDLDPAEFSPEGDLLGYVTDLQVTRLVGIAASGWWVVWELAGGHQGEQGEQGRGQ